MQPTIKPLVLSELVPALNPKLVTDGASLADLKKFLDRVLNAPEEQRVIAKDFETNICPDFYFRKARTLQIGNKDEQHIIDFLAFADGDTDKLIGAQGFHGKNAGIFQPVLDVLKPVLCDNKVLKVGQNLKFEYECAWWGLGLPIWHLFSVDLAERVIVAGIKSLKNYPYFSLEAMVERYFGLQIDKDLQQSFDLSSPLTAQQLMYCCLDIRLPLAVRTKQLEILNKDHLATTTQLENDSLGTFADMHINGQRLNRDKWLARWESNKVKLADISKQLDTYFIPVVGRVSDIPAMQAQLAVFEKAYRDAGLVTDEELAIRANVRTEKDSVKKEQLKRNRVQFEKTKAERKEAAKITFWAYRRVVKKATDVAEKAQGEALINLNSKTQLRDTLLKMKIKGVTDKTLEDTSDETLESLSSKHPVIECIRDLRTVSKQIGTYGVQWVTPWTTGPKNEEGWLHPGDGRLHSTINQLDAGTGRTTSDKPNTQNLPQDAEVRSCFIADPPDEEEPEGYSILTLDMSGAELRIIAELADAVEWIVAFAKGWDVHSVSTEVLYEQKWPAQKCLGGEKYFDKEKQKEIELPPCAYFFKDHQKCKCPEHVILRNDTKSTNFLLCYGGGPDALAVQIGKSKDEAAEILTLHEQKFPRIHAYLKKAGEEAGKKYEARTMFGRRRLFARPTLDAAEAYYRERFPERLELPEVEQKRRLDLFFSQFKRKPTNDEKETLIYRKPDSRQLSHAIAIMKGSIERRGKNHGVQGTNADIAKRALGCGFDKNGKPYLWHLAKQFKAKFLNFVHDEFVSQVPTRLAKEWAACVQDAVRRAAAEVMSKVVMESEFHISGHWQK